MISRRVRKYDGNGRGGSQIVIPQQLKSLKSLLNLVDKLHQSAKPFYQ